VTDSERAAALALEPCCFAPGALAKRFVRDMARRARQDPETALSDAQAAYLRRCVVRYRRQVPAAVVAALG
jgi:hypothetical protein